MKSILISGSIDAIKFCSSLRACLTDVENSLDFIERIMLSFLNVFPSLKIFPFRFTIPCTSLYKSILFLDLILPSTDKLIGETVFLTSVTVTNFDTSDTLDASFFSKPKIRSDNR